jgi:thiol-disulfide isomerase/thioredoxin
VSTPVRVLVLLLITVAVVVALLQETSSVELGMDDELVGQTAHLFELPVLAMEQEMADADLTDSLANHLGEVVLLDFWATTCAPCRRSIPLIERLRDRYGDQGVNVLSINVDYPSENRDALVRAFALDASLDSTILIDNGNTAYHYGARRIPLLVMVDRDGKIARVYRGFTEYGLMADGIEAILGG